MRVRVEGCVERLDERAPCADLNPHRANGPWARLAREFSLVAVTGRVCEVVCEGGGEGGSQQSRPATLPMAIWIRLQPSEGAPRLGRSQDRVRGARGAWRVGRAAPGLTLKVGWVGGGENGEKDFRPC